MDDGYILVSVERMRLGNLFFPLKDIYLFWGASLIAQLVKNLPAMQETWVLSLGQDDPVEKGEATHSSVLGLPWWLSW